MNTPVKFLKSIPVLASLDIERSAAFFATKLGFTTLHVAQGAYGMVSNGAVEIHLWACADRQIAEATCCRVQVEGIEALHAECARSGIVHPNAPLETKPWGSREFAVVDPDGSLITFFEEPEI